MTAVRDEVITKLNGEIVSKVVGQEHQAGYVGLEINRGVLELRQLRVTSIAAGDCVAQSEGKRAA